MIPRPGGSAEDDGVVLSVVTGADGNSFLLILDAGSFEEVARAQLDFAIPYQFHGESHLTSACVRALLQVSQNALNRASRA